MFSGQCSKNKMYPSGNCLNTKDIKYMLLLFSITRFNNSQWIEFVVYEEIYDGVICRIKMIVLLKIYFLANVIFIAWLGLILNPWRESLADPAWNSFSNSTNAISCLPGTRRTSLNPGYWTNSNWMSCSLVSSGRLVRKRIEFGGCSTKADWGIPPTVRGPPALSFRFFRAGSSDLEIFCLSWKVPFSLEITSESVLEKAILCQLKWFRMIADQLLWRCAYTPNLPLVYHRKGILALILRHSMHSVCLWISRKPVLSSSMSSKRWCRVWYQTGRK